MRYTHTRSDWVDPRFPVSGPAFKWSTIEWVVIHYTAAINLIDGDPGENWSNIPAYLRAIHRDYLNRKPSGYSIGYNAAVDQRGESWELRGDTYKCAANANPDVPGDENAKSFAILMLVDGQDPATHEAVVTVRDLVAQVRQQRPDTKVVGHRDVDATTCPGAGLYAQVTAGTFEPIAPSPTPTPPPVPTPTPTLPGVPMLAAVLKFLPPGATPTNGWVGWISIDGGYSRRAITSSHHARLVQCCGAIDARTGKKVEDINWADVSSTANPDELDEWLSPGAD
jgi:hypothetical protein